MNAKEELTKLLMESYDRGVKDAKQEALAALGQVWPLYPKDEWVDLTDTQIEQVYFEMVKEHRGAPMPWGQVQFGRALLGKFKEANT